MKKKPHQNAKPQDAKAASAAAAKASSSAESADSHGKPSKNQSTGQPSGPSSDQPTVAKPSGKSRWRKWLVRVAVLSVVLIVAFRISLIWVIPAVIDRVAGEYGLSASVERVELSILGTDAGLWHLKLSPKEGGDELASIDYLRVNVATWALLTGNLHIRRVEAEGVVLQLHRDPDGRLPLVDRILSSLPESKKKQSESTLSLAPPLQVDAMRLGNIKIVFFDESANPSIESNVNLNLILSDLDSPTRPTRLQLELRADPILDYLLIEGTAHTSEDELQADLNIQMRGLHPHTIEGYLQLAGLTPVAKQISATMAGRVNIRLVDPKTIAAASQPHTQPGAQAASQPNHKLTTSSSGVTSPSVPTAMQGVLELSNITLTADDQLAVGMEKLTLDISTLNSEVMNSAALKVQGVRAHASRSAQGALRLAGLEFGSASSEAKTSAATTQPRVTSTSQPVAKTAAATGKPPASRADAPERLENFRWRLGELDLQGVTLSFHDDMVVPSVDLVFQLDQLNLQDPSNQTFDMNTVVAVAGEGSAPGLAGDIRIEGKFRPFLTPLDFQATVNVLHINPQAIKPYLMAIDVESDLTDASLSMDIKADWTPYTQGGLGANLAITKFALVQDQPLLELDSLVLRELKVLPAQNKASVELVEIQGSRMHARRLPSGNLRVLGFRTTSQLSTEQRTRLLKSDDDSVAAPALQAAVDSAVKDVSNGGNVAQSTAAAGATEIALANESTTQYQEKNADTSQDRVAGNSADKDVKPPTLEGLDVLAKLPHLTIGKVAWKEVDVIWEDQMVSPAIRSHITDAGVLLENFVFDPQAVALEGDPATFRFWVASPDLFGRVELKGDILAGGQGVRVRYDVNASELHSRVLTPYLSPFGFEPVVVDGSTTVKGHIQAKRGADSWLLSALVNQLKIADGQEELGSIAGLRLEDFSLKQGHLSTKLFQIDQPQLRVKRSSDGSFVLLGIKIHPGAELPQPAKDALANLFEMVTQVQATIAQVKINEASLRWQDEMVTPQADFQTRTNLSVEGLDLGKDHASGDVIVQLYAQDAVEQLLVKGNISLVNNSPRVRVDIQGSGLTPDGARAYLPAGLSMPWKNGIFKVGIDASLGKHDDGGHAVRVNVTGLDLRDKDQAQPFVALKDAIVDFTRYDPDGGLVQLAEISAHGFETHIHRASNGQLTAGGVTLTAPPENKEETATTQPASTQPQNGVESAVPTQPTMPAQTVASSVTSATQSITTQPATTQPAVSTVPSVAADQKVKEDLAAVLARRRQTAPLIVIGKLDLEASRISIRDDMRPKSKPLLISNMTLVSDGSIEVLGPASAQTPPVKLKLRLEPLPIAKTIKMEFITRPFDDQVKLGMAMEIAGINGQGLFDVLPELAEQLQADDLKDGVFKMRFGVLAKLDRPRPWLFNPQRGGVFNFGIAEMQMLQSPNGLVLGGMKAMRVESINVSPGWTNIRIGNAEVNQLTFNSWRDKAGLHVMGFTLPLTSEDLAPPPPVTAESDTQANADEPAVAAVPETSATPSKAAEPQVPGMVVEINRLTMNGLDGKFEDRTVTPVMMLPLTGMVLDVRNLSSSPSTQKRPLRFNMLLTSGKVKVPVREQGVSVTGVLGDTAKFITGRKTKTRRVEMVERDLFSQITASGRVRFNPKPDGWVKFSVNGLDLWSLRGTASQVGVDIGGGALDLNVDGRFDDNGDLDTKSRVVLSDLSISEPSNGPISRYLLLPAPLDAVLVAVRSNDGSITLPINLKVSRSAVNKRQVMGQVLGAVSSVLVKAFTSSPLKLASGVGSFVGVNALMGGKSSVDYAPVVVEYLPGQTVPESAFDQTIDTLIKRMASDKKLNVILCSQISMADVEVASVRANPSREECLQLIADLSKRVRELSYQRADVAGQARAELASMAADQYQQSLLKLHAIDRQMIRLQESLDGVYDLLQPGSKRNEMRRTRTAAIAIGQARLEYIAIRLFESDIPNALQRVQVTPSQFNPIDPTSDSSTDEQDQNQSEEKVEAAGESGQTTQTTQPGQQAESENSHAEFHTNEHEDKSAAPTESAENAETTQAAVVQGESSEDVDSQDLKESASSAEPAVNAPNMMGQVVITLIPTR